MVVALELDGDKPRTLAEALASKDASEWKKAVQDELDNLAGKGTWTEAKLPDDRKAIGCKWVLKRKRDAEGNITTYKARLVA